ncbi:MAG: undecaprenyl-diphosphate phosphatase [Candidatus Krumholzibacteriota bacterium]|nr:undecaprenyl-diphosphate phosphatase [Candidatus Krumholzibacteriota bacterium]
MPARFIEVLLLALIQGLTEFLPVSSSGHLALAEALLRIREEGTGDSIIFEIAVHVGTLGAVVAVYRKKVFSLCRSLAGWVCNGFTDADKYSGDIGYLGWIILGSVPAAIVGLLLRDRVAEAFNAPGLVSACLVVTGIFLMLSRGRGGRGSLTWKSVLLIGAAQAVAILPGCSRSGWTITTALLLGLGFEKGAEFSFLLSIPAILGALALELCRGGIALSSPDVILILTGMGAAFLSGLLALKLLIYLLRQGVFFRFSYYLIPLGVLGLVYFVFIN